MFFIDIEEGCMIPNMLNLAITYVLVYIFLVFCLSGCTPLQLRETEVIERAAIEAEEDLAKIEEREL